MQVYNWFQWRIQDFSEGAPIMGGGGMGDTATYGYPFFALTTKIMAKQNDNLVISPSDEDSSELDEFADFLFTNEVTQVNAIDVIN